jgi:hypothetical protein
MRSNRVLAGWLVAAALTTGTIVQADPPAAPPATAPAAPATPDPTANSTDNVAKILKLADPEIEALRKIDFSGVDLKTVDMPTKTMAVMATNNFLAKQGERARMRVGLLEDYIELRGLQDEFSQNSAEVPEQKLLPLEDGIRLAVVMVSTPEGQDAYGKQVQGVKPETLTRVYNSYYSLCRKNWGEVAYSRFRVQEMASFLDAKGMLNDFIAWAKDEKNKQAKARAEASTKFLADRKEEDEKARAKRVAVIEKREAEERELFNRRLEYSYEIERARVSNYGNYGNYNYRW